MLDFLHAGHSGDVICSLPTVYSLAKRHGEEKVNFHLELGKMANLCAGGDHPNGPYMMTEASAAALIPLLACQPIFNHVGVFEGGTYDFDLSLFRFSGFPLDRGYIARHYFFAFAANYDLSQPWLWVEPDERYRGRVVVNRTTRYVNHKLNYKVLDDFKPVFLGLPEEWELMGRYLPDAEYVPTTDLLQAARIIAAAKLFVGNQSCLYSIAEALKTGPRLLETCLFCPNVIPHGANAFEAIGQQAFDQIVREQAE